MNPRYKMLAHFERDSNRSWRLRRQESRWSAARLALKNEKKRNERPTNASRGINYLRSDSLAILERDWAMGFCHHS